MHFVFPHQLMASRLEKEEHEICIQKAKEEALQNITDVMENELQCSVCAELFIQVGNEHMSSTASSL